MQTAYAGFPALAVLDTLYKCIEICITMFVSCEWLFLQHLLGSRRGLHGKSVPGSQGRVLGACCQLPGSRPPWMRTQCVESCCSSNSRFMKVVVGGTLTNTRVLLFARLQIVVLLQKHIPIPKQIYVRVSMYI